MEESTGDVGGSVVQRWGSERVSRSRHFRSGLLKNKSHCSMRGWTGVGDQLCRFGFSRI